jgi:GalNAc-alpha-(1->4)-GalNAc-alpha-(1->3)-diNAcBac-PP-undecaprenol alpha-1,4-N-acetyl-D-galactosaminyltransferase
MLTGTDKNFKLLIISPSLKAGGIERALTVLANNLVQKGVEVVFFVCLPYEVHYQVHSKVRVVRSNIPYRGKCGKLLFYPRLMWKIRTTAKIEKANAVLSFGDVFNPIVLAALFGTKHRIFISDRTSPSFKIHPLAEKLKTLYYPRSSGFIAQTERVRKHMEKRFSGSLNLKVIPNAIQQVQPMENLCRKESILYVGRLSWEKGVDRLIKAFAQMKQKGKWHLDLVGDGPQTSQLKELVEKSNLDNQVTFHGLQKETAPFYNQSSIFVLPSHIEGFPNAMCEAMSAGLPVVCFDTIPYESIIEVGKNGLVAIADDTQDMAKQLDELVLNSSLRKTMEENNKERVKDFDAAEIASTFLDFMKP